MKTAGLFDTIPKSRRLENIATRRPKYDIKKETVASIRNIDYARLRNYDIKILIQYELTSTSFYLTKDSYLRMPQKYELGQEIRKSMKQSSSVKQSCPSVVPPPTGKCMIVIDFMAYARKVTVKSSN